MAMVAEELRLEAEGVIPPNPAMRSAIQFAHALRMLEHSTPGRADQLIQFWWNVYRSYGWERFRNTFVRANQAGQILNDLRFRQWLERRNVYVARQDAKLQEGSISSSVYWRRRDDWDRRNPDPRYVARHERQSSIPEIFLCSECDTPHLGAYMATQSLCRDCRARTQWCCDECGQWFRNGVHHRHPPRPREGSSCRAPQERFRMPNKLLLCGYQPSDRIVHVRTNSAGSVSDSAMAEIARLVRSDTNRLDWIGSYDIKSLVGAQWENREGKFSKRLPNLLYKEYRVKLSAEATTKIGNLARQNMVSDSDRYIEFTRKLDRNPGQFLNNGSCWWDGQTYGRSRCILKENGGMAMRLFDGGGRYSGPIARAWVVPLDGDLRANVHDPMQASAYLLFNAYAETSNAHQEMSSLLASLVGMDSVQRLDEDDTYKGGSGMYVNGGSVYLISPRKTRATPQFLIDKSNVQCSCITHEPEPSDTYAYDDSDFSTVLVSDPTTNNNEAADGREARIRAEEEEPEDDRGHDDIGHVIVAYNHYDDADDDPDDF
jgi:hypothetical protein